jgi:mannosylglycerate hydrolase
MNMNSKKKAYILPHTHWDREWRYPIWQNRMLLVRFMDELLEILENDPEYHCFLMDGQVVPLLDYLEIRPENRDRIKAQVEAGRLLVGPWYTLPDLYPLDGECLIRNLQKGMRISETFGGFPKVAYHSFGWGQTAQFPQIYNQLGFDLIIAAKKLSAQRAPQSEFIWQAPDGTEMLTTRLGKEFRANGFFYVHIPVVHGVDIESDDYALDWSKAGQLIHWADHEHGGQDYFRQDRETGYHKEKLHGAMQEAWENMDDSACSDKRMLMYGSDFTTPNHHLTRVVRDANELFDDIDFEIVGPEAYAKVLHRELDKEKLKVLTGELREGPANGCSANALAVRMPIKLLNKEVENLLIRKAEPLAAMLYLMGGDYPETFLEKAWDYMLKAHPHDSINGVTQDKSVADTMYRLNQAKEIAEALCLENASQLAARIDLSDFNKEDQCILLINPQPRPARSIMKLSVDTPREPCVEFFVLEDAAGRQLDVQALSREERKTPVNDFDARPWPFYSDRHTVLADTGEIPAGGYKVVKVVPTSRFGRATEWWPNQPVSGGNEISQAPRTLENEFLKVVADSNGTLTLTEKASGRQITGLLEFEDTGDTGDYWAHYKPSENRQIYSAGTPAEIWLEENGPLSATLAVRVNLTVPEGAEFPHQKLQGCGRRSDAETNLTIVSRVTLERGAKSLRVKTRVDNRAENHRLRVLIPTDIETDVADSAGHFNVDRRSARPLHNGNNESYPEMQTVPMQRFVDVTDGTNGFAVTSNSLTEYELMTDSRRTLALTLFRSVRNRICTEKRCTGEFPDQKGGQLLETMEFEYGLYPHRGDWAEGQVYAEADRLNTEPMAFQVTPSGNGTCSTQASLFKLESDTLVLSSVKKLADRDGVAVRMFNPTSEQEPGMLVMGPEFGKVYRLNVNEERQEKLTVKDGVIMSTFGPGEIVTVELEAVPKGKKEAHEENGDNCDGADSAAEYSVQHDQTGSPDHQPVS